MNHRKLAARLVLPTAAIALAGCGSPGTSPSNTPPRSQQSTSPPQSFQHRTLACGTDIAGPAAPSSPNEQVQLAITGTSRRGDSLAVAFAITSPNPTEVLTLPIDPTPPTALLIHDGRIVGFKHQPGPGGTVDGLPATGYKLEKPYTGTLVVDQLCPGTTWEHVWKDTSLYQVEVVMSRQPSSGPQTAPPPSYLPDPLTVAVTPPKG